MALNWKLALGFGGEGNGSAQTEREEQLRYLNLKLAANGLPVAQGVGGAELVSLASGLLANFREKTRLLDSHRCPVDARIEGFLNRHFADLNLEAPLRIPARAMVLDRHGLARELSLPAGGDEFASEYGHSYRVRNGVLHNPRSDRRTTAGTFHVVEGGLPIPSDKRAVPRRTFVALFRRAVAPPSPVLQLPFTSLQEEQARCWASVLLRPIVRPEVPGYCAERSMEIRFFAPGALVSNLDFVESIFGNAGDPYVPANDAGLDVEHWSGHTGCVILAPHLPTFTKKELGLPHVSQATERQRRDRMCWERADERYNDGEAFKLACRTDEGVIVTVIADSYFGYCKKEVKTQISYAANLMGGVEEEHAGGALVFQSWSLGEAFQVNSKRYNGRTLDDLARDYGELIEFRKEGYGVDRKYPQLIYIPEDARADLRRQDIAWTRDGQEHSIPLLPGRIYMAPSGYKIRMEKHPSAPSWRLIGTAGEGVFCHKPCTVSGGGKSEISKSLGDYMQYGPIFVADFEEDMRQVEEIFQRDYTPRWRPEKRAERHYEQAPSRPILSPRRSLGSVIKLLTPSDDYTDEYNEWLRAIPSRILAMVFIIKRFHRPEWGDGWRGHFGVDLVNGSPGNELKLHERKLVGTYLRVGFHGRRDWRLFKVRQDFFAASKVQTEDDISASVVVPAHFVEYPPRGAEREADFPPAENRPEPQAGCLPHEDSYKFVINCEYRLFQRPDDAIHRGFDRQAEADLARRDVNFVSNFEPLRREQVVDMMEKVVDFDAFTPPMKKLLRQVKKSPRGYVVCSDNPRRIDGVPSKNPRYLQDRPEITDPLRRYVAEMGTRLFRAIPANKPVPLPVNAVLSGRRNNPPDAERGHRGLAVFSPVHYQELPELFMDYICSLTGKSPSTTGAGSEGALTKGPFNCIRPAADLNAALVAMILTGHAGFSTAAGYVGPHQRFDHDLSLLVPEIWCRMTPEERRPEFLIEHGLLERVVDFTWQNERIPASRLGYRITQRFVLRFCGRVFDHPDKVFDESILRPETQDLAAFADGVKYICEAHQRVARQYFEDGSIEQLCPPLQALVTIMAHGSHQGKTEHDPEIRSMFTRDALWNSDWYRRRLHTAQERERALFERHADYLAAFSQDRLSNDPALRAVIALRRRMVKSHLDHLQSPGYLHELEGTLGAQPQL